MSAFIDSAVDAVETIVEMASRYMIGRDLAQYCDLVTAVGISDADLKEYPDLKDPHILVTSSSAMVSVFDVQGTFGMLSPTEFEDVIRQLRVKLGSYFREAGHSISFVFERDPDRSTDELMRLTEPMLNTARRIGLDAADILLSRVERNAPLVAWEQNLLVVYTHMSVLSPREQKRVVGKRLAEARAQKLPLAKFGQSPALVLAELKIRHDSFVARIKDDLLKSGLAGQGGILVERLSAHEAARVVRQQLDREHTSQKWRPVLPGDVVKAHGHSGRADFSDVSLPKLNYQIASNDMHASGDFVSSDRLIQTAISLELGPQEVFQFPKLLDQLSRSIPWRIRFDLEPGGLDKSRLNRTMLSFVGMFPGNRHIAESYRYLTQVDREDPVCTMRVAASTWGNSANEVEDRRAALEKALQSWGACQVRASHGDPILALGSTIAAFSTASVGNMMFPPISEALQLLPLQRPATPWSRHGGFIQRTPDGKIFPITLNSRLQDVDIRLISAPPGSGKSMLLNSMHLATSLRAGATRLPLMTIIDVGVSGTGFIQVLRDGLPDERKNEALAIRLANDVRYAVNPFDTQLGANDLTLSERDFVVDLMVGLLTDTRTLKTPSSDAARLCGHLVKNVYKKMMGAEAKPFEFGVELQVDAAINDPRLGLEQDQSWWLDATWLEVRDLLFTAGRTREAMLCHLRAMPTLPDVAACLNDKEIVQLYGTATITGGEPLTKYAMRAFSAAADMYGLFSGRTRFELGAETRVLLLDLQEVIGSSTSNDGMLRTALMYMFARNLGARNYFLVERELLEVLPDDGRYTKYHLDRLKDIKDEQKILAYDELHNTGKPGNAEGRLNIVMDRMIKDGREGRKWGLSIIGATQYLPDYPDELLNAATSIYVMRGGNAADIKVLREKWDVSDESIRRLNLEATGPTPQGGNYLALFKTKVGNICQILTNTPGPVELWGFSTTPDDMSIRQKIFAAIGPSEGRLLLARRFKSGTAALTMDAMRLSANDGEHGSVSDRLAGELLREYSESMREEAK